MQRGDIGQRTTTRDYTMQTFWVLNRERRCRVRRLDLLPLHSGADLHGDLPELFVGAMF